MNSVAAYTAEHGGGTFEATTLLPFEPRDGFAVGMAEGTAAQVSRADQLDETCLRVAQEFGASYIGTWLDPDDESGRVSVDPVAYIKTLGDAMSLGLTNGQKAIYDFSTGTTLDLTEGWGDL